jgi:hypothetical protein
MGLDSTPSILEMMYISDLISEFEDKAVNG